MSKSDKLRARLVMKGEVAQIQKSPGFPDASRRARKNLTDEMSDKGAEMSETERALLDVEPGRVSDARAARWLASVAFETTPEWSVELVRECMRNAARGIERVVGRVGPASKSGFWPDPEAYANATAADRNIAFQSQQIGAQAPVRDAAGDSLNISRHEMAIYWPALYLSADEHEAKRLAVHLWGWCEAKNESFDNFYHALGCKRRMAQYRLRDGFEAISAGLIKDGVHPWRG